MKYAFKLCLAVTFLMLAAIAVDWLLSLTSLARVSKVIFALVIGGLLYHAFLEIKFCPVIEDEDMPDEESTSTIHFPRHWSEARKAQYLRDYGHRVQPYDSQVAKL